MAMVIENERLLAIESKLDQTIDVVFGLLRADNSESIHDAAILYGLPSIRKLYSLSKVHRDYGMSAEIKWVRDGETKKKVLTQQQEFDQLCQIIETRGDEEVESATLTGTLATWDTVGRRFILVFPEAEPVRGTFAEAFDASSPRTVQDRYEVKLLKRTAFNYVTDQERISWELIGIAEIK
jgi:hypothetical protein